MRDWEVPQVPEEYVDRIGKAVEKVKELIAGIEDGRARAAAIVAAVDILLKDEPMWVVSIVHTGVNSLVYGRMLEYAWRDLGVIE